MPTPDAPSNAILLTRRGEQRMAEVARTNRETGAPLSPLQMRVLVDDLVESGDCWTLGPDSGRRVRALMQAAGLDLTAAEDGASGLRRIGPNEISQSLGAVRSTRGLMVQAIARAVGASDEWDHLISFLQHADGDQGVVAIPWPDGDVPIEAAPASARRRRPAGRPRARGPRAS